MACPRQQLRGRPISGTRSTQTGTRDVGTQAGAIRPHLVGRYCERAQPAPSFRLLAERGFHLTRHRSGCDPRRTLPQPPTSGCWRGVGRATSLPYHWDNLTFPEGPPLLWAHFRHGAWTGPVAPNVGSVAFPPPTREALGLASDLRAALVGPLGLSLHQHGTGGGGSGMVAYGKAARYADVARPPEVRTAVRT